MELLRSHTPKGARAREHIVRSAERLFAASGFHGTSMRDVAIACDQPLASVVYHFARKEQLYAAVLGEIGEQLVAQLSAAVEDDARSWALRLDAVVRALLHWTESHPGRVKLLLRELLDNPARVARASRLPLAPVLLRLSEFVSAGIEAGAFRAATPETSVLHLVGAVSYFVAARPTVKRIVGAARDRKLMASYDGEAIDLARRMFLVTGETEAGRRPNARMKAR